MSCDVIKPVLAHNLYLIGSRSVSDFIIIKSDCFGLDLARNDIRKYCAILCRYDSYDEEQSDSDGLLRFYLGRHRSSSEDDDY